MSFSQQNSTRKRTQSSYYKDKRNSCPPSFFDNNLRDLQQSVGLVKRIADSVNTFAFKPKVEYHEWKPPPVNIVKKKMSTMGALNRISSQLQQNPTTGSKVLHAFFRGKANATDIFEETTNNSSFSNTSMDDIDELFETGYDDVGTQFSIDETVDFETQISIDNELAFEDEFNAIIEEKAREYLIRSPDSPYERYYNENLLDCIFANYENVHQDKWRYQKILLDKWSKLPVRERAKYNDAIEKPIVPKVLNFGKVGLRTNISTILDQNLKTLQDLKSIGLGIFLPEFVDDNVPPPARPQRRIRKKMSSWDILPKSESKGTTTVNLENYSLDDGEVAAAFDEDAEGSIATAIKIKAVSGSPKTVAVKPQITDFRSPFDHYVSENKNQSVKKSRKKWLLLPPEDKVPYVSQFANDYKGILRTYEMLKAEGYRFEQVTN